MNRRTLFAVGSTAAVLVLLGTYLYFSHAWQFFIRESRPIGRITFSVSKFPLDTSLPGGIMTLTADLTRTTYSVPKPDPAGTLEYQYRMVATSSRPWVVFVRATGLTGVLNDISKVPFEVYRANLHGVPWSQLDAKIDQAEKVTNNPGTVKMFPEISNSGHVAYMAQPISATKGTSVEDWSVHLVPDGGKDTVVSSGMYPKWVNDGQFVFLKNDGLYLYTISTKKTQRVLGVDGRLSNVSTLYVSDDGRYVAWSVPEKKSLLIIEAHDWKTGQFALKGSVPIVGWYPVISPDNRFAAIVTEVKQSQNKWFPIISFVDLSNLKLLKASTFSLYDTYKTTRAEANLGEVLPEGTNPNYIVLNSWLQSTSNSH